MSDWTRERAEAVGALRALVGHSPEATCDAIRALALGVPTVELLDLAAALLRDAGRRVERLQSQREQLLLREEARRLSGAPQVPLASDDEVAEWRAHTTHDGRWRSE